MISALYIPQSIPHKFLLRVLLQIMHFVYKPNVRSKIGLLPTSIYWNSIGFGKRYFTEKNPIKAMTFLIKNCYFSIKSILFKQILSRVMFKILKKLARAYKYHATSRFIG